MPLRRWYGEIEDGAAARWATLPLRAIVGVGFVQHGLTKLGRGVEAFAEILRGLGAPTPLVLAWGTIGVELLGGVAILLGAFVPLVAIPMAAVLVVAIVTVHLPYGFSSIRLEAVTAEGARFGPVGYECALLYLACLAALVLAGPGPFSVDRWRASAVAFKRARRVRPTLGA